MRIVCPFCAATYDVPENLIDGQRIVRCARCGQEWKPRPGGAELAGPGTEAPTANRKPEPAPPPWIPEPEPRNLSEMAGQHLAATAERQTSTATQPRVLAIDRLMQPWEPEGPGVAVWLAWAASIGLVLLLVWAGYVWRGSVMHVWPASQRLYAALGLS
jgi:predicted Zn finger-like uncharacterized protein